MAEEKWNVTFTVKRVAAQSWGSSEGSQRFDRSVNIRFQTVISVQ